MFFQKSANQKNIIVINYFKYSYKYVLTYSYNYVNIITTNKKAAGTLPTNTDGTNQKKGSPIITQGKGKKQ